MPALPSRPDAQRADPNALARAHARLAAVPLAPSVVLDAGDSVTAFWLGAEPISDLPQLVHLNHRAATLVRGHWKPAESLATSLVAVPGTRNARLLPAPDVAIVTWAPERRYTLAELVAAVGG